MEETITYSQNSSSDGYVPKIKSKDGERDFLATDMSRVLDFSGTPDPPPDGPMLHCESGGKKGMKFPVRHFCLRGSFFFYFELGDVDDESKGDVTYHGAPLGVIPLDHVSVEFPPGGRRVFREHAHTDARNGYELVILHAPDKDNTTRFAQFLVAESLHQRERWAKAIRERAEIQKETKLRPNLLGESSTRGDGNGGGGRGIDKLNDSSRWERTTKVKKLDVEQKKSKKELMDEEVETQRAIQEFGVDKFDASLWVTKFFQKNNDFDAPTRCRSLEQWQSGIKKGLKGAVSEQYEYFVEASSEMTTMGREVASLRQMVEAQAETIKEMKEIDFAAAFTDPVPEEGELMSSDDEDVVEPPRMGGQKLRRRRGPRRQSSDDASDASSISSTEGDHREVGRRAKGRQDEFHDGSNDALAIEVPSWLKDVAEEISAYIKECRYTDAAELLFKAKTEIGDIVSQHDKPTERKLTKEQYNDMQSTLQDIEGLTERMSSRLVEGLRRKNEALKQAAKRERADPLSLMAPMVSPCCLNDDVIPLQLLVKLGKTQDAATSYAARRSLLLMEALHERPISGTSTVDLVIYSAQLSQSFFSCLANAVEGFLDLFLTAEDAKTKDVGDGDSIDQSSMQSSKNIPPGALAAIVLWCDSELSKFSSAFGGTRILGNLALSPPPRDVDKRSSRFDVDEIGEQTKERQNAIELAAQCVDQAFQYASQNLDSIGLPLTPRLAEYVRSRLKGCEGEVAHLLSDRWKHLAFDWEVEVDFDDQPMDERRSLGPLRAR
mmetsp:Transcript_28823/g.40428  ORF Transcript_28823/g.40428 Transcript_28823/m.40428 type:complete len:777 (+) Transcript_28823:278-2608(+)